MGETINQGAKEREVAAETTYRTGQFQVFDDLVSFSKAIETAAGVTFDLAALIQLNTDFAEASEQYLLLNIKEYGVEKPDNMLFLAEDCRPSAIMGHGRGRENRTVRGWSELQVR